MADFKISYNKTSSFEGGYVNNHLDKGGETYKGISRKNFPGWKGWSIVDNYKSKLNFPKNMKNDSKLESLVSSFYKANFWNKLRGDEIESQDIANNIYDFAVNSGVIRAIKFAQFVLKVEESGIINDEFLRKINSFGSATFIHLYKNVRQDYINKIVQNNHSQKIFLAGWTDRIRNV